MVGASPGSIRLCPLPSPLGASPFNTQRTDKAIRIVTATTQSALPALSMILCLHLLLPGCSLSTYWSRDLFWSGSFAGPHDHILCYFLCSQFRIWYRAWYLVSWFSLLMIVDSSFVLLVDCYFHFFWNLLSFSCLYLWVGLYCSSISWKINYPWVNCDLSGDLLIRLLVVIQSSIVFHLFVASAKLSICLVDSFLMSSSFIIAAPKCCICFHAHDVSMSFEVSMSCCQLC